MTESEIETHDRRMPQPGAGLRKLAGAVHRSATALNNILFDGGMRSSRRLEKPVISVGNLALGGTGKTPVTLHLHRLLTTRSHRPSVLLRGYSRGKISDEALLYSRWIPESSLFVGPDRHASGMKAEAAGHDLHLLDDGFQHRRLHRDCDIVLIDCIDPFYSHAWLREGFGSLRRAHIVLLTRARSESDVAPELRRQLAPFDRIPRFFAHFSPEQSLSRKKVFLFCAIGNPDGFVQTVVAAGGEIVGCRLFRDHHEYTEDEVASIRWEADQRQADALITTEKDAVRIDGEIRSRLGISVLTTRTEISEGFIEAVLDRIGDRR